MATMGILLLFAAHCGSEAPVTTPASEPSPRPPDELSAAAPEDDRSPAGAERTDRHHAEDEERWVTTETRTLGRHQFFAVHLYTEPWGPRDVSIGAGVESVEVLHRRFQNCRRDEHSSTSHILFCPDLGLVEHYRREGGYRVEERLIAYRRGATVLSESTCAVFHFLGEDVRQRLCEPSTRSLGGDPRPSSTGCRWRYGPARPADGHEAHVTVRLDRDPPSVRDWAHGSSGDEVVNNGTRRTWIAEANGWIAAVQIDLEFCGNRSGRSVADELLMLAPLNLTDSQVVGE